MHRKLSSVVAAVGLLFSTAACYHAIVDTGRPAGSTVVNKPWVATWVFGLVPAQELNVAAECPNGIARVETQQSFVNGLVGVITLGIYTPQTATITCAASRTGLLPAGALPVVVAHDASLAARTAAVQAAAEESARTHGAVLVRF